MIEQVEALARQGLDAQQVADKLGITRKHLRRKLNKLGAHELNSRLPAPPAPPRDPEVVRRNAKAASDAALAKRLARLEESYVAIIEDVEWLIDCGEHPVRIAKRVNRSVVTLYELFLETLNRPDLAAHFSRHK